PGRLLIEVEDSGEGLQQPVNEGLGLSNTRERLIALHPGAQLRLNTNLEGGCTARMEIPA
ncbi:MAG: histidine kinase, partial [Inhella sp.]